MWKAVALGNFPKYVMNDQMQRNHGLGKDEDRYIQLSCNNYEAMIQIIIIAHDFFANDLDLPTKPHFWAMFISEVSSIVMKQKLILDMVTLFQYLVFGLTIRRKI